MLPRPTSGDFESKKCPVDVFCRKYQLLLASGYKITASITTTWETALLASVKREPYEASKEGLIFPYN